jgi:hypothetical protein
MTYAVLWNEDGGPTIAGKLELSEGVLHLEGAQGRLVRLALPIDTIASARIGRNQAERLRGLPVLILDLLGGGRIRITTLSGVGRLHELADVVGAR